MLGRDGEYNFGATLDAMTAPGRDANDDSHTRPHHYLQNRDQEQRRQQKELNWCQKTRSGTMKALSAMTSDEPSSTGPFTVATILATLKAKIKTSKAARRPRCFDIGAITLLNLGIRLLSD